MHAMRISVCFVMLLACGLVLAAQSDSWQQLERRAAALYHDGHFDDAAGAMRGALAQLENQSGHRSADQIRLLDSYGAILKAQKHYAEAEQAYGRAAAYSDLSLAEDDRNRMHSLWDLAQLYVVEAKYSQAEPVYRRVIQWQQKHLDLQDGDLANSQQELSQVYTKLGRKDDADRLARRAFAAVEVPARAHGLIPALPDTYSEAQKSAAVAIDIVRRRTEATFEECIAHAQDDEFRFSLHIWQVENLDVTLPADHVLATIAADQRNALATSLDHGKNPDAAPNDALCQLLSASMRKGQSSYAQTDAEAAQTLHAIYAADNTMRIAKRDADFTLGCMKQRYNAGAREAAPTGTLCACQTRAIKSRATDAQIDVWLAQNSNATGKQPAWFDQARATAAQCAVGTQ